MTADGTYRSSRVGEAVTTPAELDALPVGSVVLDRGRNVWQSPERGLWACPMDSTECGTAALAKHEAPLTVLHRPDAPQPAPTDDAVERAARAWHEAANDDDADNYAVLAWEDLPADLHAIATRRMAPALAAAGAGEAGFDVTAEQVDHIARAIPRLIAGTSGHPGTYWWSVVRSALIDAGLRVDTDLAHAREAARAAGDGAEVDRAEQGRRLASEREDLIAQGVDPGALEVPLHPGGEAVDREALAEVMYEAARGTGSRHTAPSWPNASEGSHTPWRAAANAAAAFLAARGDAAPTAPGPLTIKFDVGRGAMLDRSGRIVGYFPEDWAAPTVDAEQVEAASESADRLEPPDEQAWRVLFLRALGIEVTRDA